MSIRSKTLAIILATLTSLVIVLYAASQVILIESYSQLELEFTERNVSRVSNAINERVSNLATLTSDWAWWDAPYAYIRGEFDDFLETELIVENLAKFGINAFVFLDATRRVVYSTGIDLESTETIDTPEAVLDFITLPDVLVFDSLTDTTSGLVLLDGQPALIAAVQVLTSRQEGPAVGSLIFVQYLDETRAQELSDALDLNLSLLSPNDPNLNATDTEMLSRLGQVDSIEVNRADAENAIGYTLKADLIGNPALLIRVETVREIYQQGQTTITTFIIILIAASVLFTGLILYLLEGALLSRLTRLTSQVEQIGIGGNLRTRIELPGQDELLTLAESINAMLGRLEQSQSALREGEERLRTIVNNAPILIWAVDEQKQLSLIEGSSVVEVLNTNPQKLLGKRIHETDLQHLVDVNSIDLAYQGELAVSLKSYHNTTFTTRYQPLRNGEGRIIGVIGVATDITTSQQTKDALQRAYSTLEQKNRQIRRAQEIVTTTLHTISEAIQRHADHAELSTYITKAQEALDHANDRL